MSQLKFIVLLIGFTSIAFTNIFAQSKTAGSDSLFGIKGFDLLASGASKIHVKDTAEFNSNFGGIILMHNVIYFHGAGYPKVNILNISKGVTMRALLVFCNNLQSGTNISIEKTWVKLPDNSRSVKVTTTFIFD